MKDFFKAVGKGLIMFGIAAALWAALTPALAIVLAPALGVSAAGMTGAGVASVLSALHPVLWTGASFGMFGGLYAGVLGVASAVYKKIHHAPAVENAKPAIAANSEPEKTCAISFTKNLEQERATTQREYSR